MEKNILKLGALKEHKKDLIRRFDSIKRQLKQIKEEEADVRHSI